MELEIGLQAQRWGTYENSQAKPEEIESETAKMKEY